MRLSEAIRLGALLKPQAFGLMTRDGGTCAWGAALEAAGIRFNCFGTLAPLPDDWKVLSATLTTCPACGDECHVGGIMGGHLNDIHRWTRERIADWVATIERAESPAAREAEALVSVEVVNDGNSILV